MWGVYLQLSPAPRRHFCTVDRALTPFRIQKLKALMICTQKGPANRVILASPAAGWGHLGLKAVSESCEINAGAEATRVAAVKEGKVPNR